ncbi:hydrogen peroxide-dependent heme synthase [Bythopirellula goksoeyrii]|uniref:Putative heme peroxidase n=1 Tax=Bythopirellula goksoeyrii TaxID=1400387 RepID=A0A5B9QN06_9BACT|nr:hydrogen peroxide-dependent heme synthase [Bythopirellula goksoeyrii]QEG35383.1 putative heme peroxidase [Bythopirellula goksoeyrii]
MSRPHVASPPSEISLSPADGGWHCSHLYYSWNRAALAQLPEAKTSAGIDAVIALLDPEGADAPLRMQTSVVSGNKADFGLMLMDPDPLKVDRVRQRLMASPLGQALVPGYSFVSMTEISEYVPTVEEFGERLVAEGESVDSPTYAAKVKGYADRLEGMNRQRLTPELPDWPCTCFYPMNKKRKVGENWFTLSKEERNALMSEHARSGMAFAGKVKQLITVALGFDDWEWGVTLWAANPEYLKDIVYRMRFDEASARYAEFGPFLVSYVCTPAEMLKHCQVSV